LYKFGIYFGMTLQNCTPNKVCKIISINNDDEKLKLRLYEVGFFECSKIMVLKKSCLNQTLLVQVLDSCFAIKTDMAELFEVEYE